MVSKVISSRARQHVFLAAQNLENKTMSRFLVSQSKHVEIIDGLKHDVKGCTLKLNTCLFVCKHNISTFTTCNIRKSSWVLQGASNTWYSRVYFLSINYANQIKNVI